MTQALDLKLSNDRNLKKLLKATVETTRKILKCDRVIVYSADELPKALVVAESVEPKYSSILGKTIKDPFLEGKHLEMYRYGLAVAIDDIYTADIGESDLEDIEKLGIKGLAIAPISVENKLFALLVAHQCSKLQSWHPEAVNFLTRRANTAGFALSNIGNVEKSKDSDFTKQTENSQNNQNSPTMARKENSKGKESLQPPEQKTIIQGYRSHLFADVSQTMSDALDREDILTTTVEEVRQLLECDRVVVYSVNQDNYGLVVAESVASPWTKALGRTIDDPCFAARYLEKYSQGRVRAWDNVYCGDATPCYLEQLEALEVKANLVAPIISEGHLFGLLIAHQCSHTRNWQKQEINWITETATKVGLMLEYTKKLAETNRKEPKQLADSQTNSPKQGELEAANQGQQTALSVDESKWNQHFTDAIQYIRQSLKKEDILKASVKEVRRVLNCDRVVVYSMNQDNYGMIVAESVASGWTRAQGRVIKDPCFEAKYLDMYRNGRVRAWSNIYDSGMTRCYIEQLEELEVKANLVTPIVNEGKLFGLLVAHQCSDARQWQQPEIRWVTQIATQVGFALDNAQLLADAKQLQYQLENETKLTKYFTDAVRYIRESLHQEDILEVSVEEVRRVLNCDRVVVYSMNQDNYGTIVAESVAPGWTRAQGRVIKDPCFEAKYLDMYRNGRVRAWSNIYESGMTRCYIEQLEELEVKANLVTPIINEGKLFGLLVAHQCSDTRQWQQPEIRWVAQIATQVGFALDNAKLLEQLEQSTKTSARVSYEQYEQTETLKHQVVEILAENGDAYQTLSQEAMRQSETTIKVLHQIQEVADSFSGIALNVQQLKFQEQQNDLAVQSTQESLDRAVNSISNIQRTVQNVAVGFDNISHSCQKLSETVNTIKDLSKQIVQQSMSLTRAVNRNQIQEEDNQNSIIDLSDTIFSLMQELFEATAKIEPLFANIKAEVLEKTIALDSGTQQLISEVGEFQTVRQKLDQVVTLNNKMSNLIENISKSVEHQIQSSTFAKDSVQEVAAIAERISKQSMAITQSFNQLVVLVQQL
jgi:methyl-accepting chemotaxis protein PixJ